MREFIRRLEAAGLTVEPTPATLLVSARTNPNAVNAGRPGYAAAMAKMTEEIIAAARAAGVEVTVTQKPKGTVEITPLPGVRRPEREATIR